MEQLKGENEEMAMLLQTHGIPYQSSFFSRTQSMTGSMQTGSSTGSMTGASMSRTQTVESSPFPPSMSYQAPTAPMQRSPHNPNGNMGFPAPSPVNASGIASQHSYPAPSPVDASSIASQHSYPVPSPMDGPGLAPQSPTHMTEYATQNPIGMAITTDYNASSTGHVPQFKELGGIFRDHQVSVDFVQE